MTVQPLTRPGMGGPGVLDEDRGLIRACLVRLREWVDPLSGDPWGVGPLTIADITGHHDTHPVSGTDHECPADYPGEHCRGCEIRRIAYLVEHGWPYPDLDPHPVTIDVGFGDPWLTWPLVDGNHRVAAAIVRGEPFIDLSACGDWDRAVSLLVPTPVSTAA